MADEPQTYQPKWDERKDKKRHHHHHHVEPNESNRGLGGALRMKDKQAYYGLMFILGCIIAFGAFKLIMLLVDELRAMPMDDPKLEMNVDELNVRKVDKQDALLLGDSLAQSYRLDSTSIKRVQTDEHQHHVYRPPRREREWYITQREWRDIKRNMKRWKQAQKNDKKLEKEKKEKKE